MKEKSEDTKKNSFISDEYELYNHSNLLNET